MTTPAVIAAAMQQQAESAGVSHRRLPDGLHLRLRFTADGVFILDMLRRDSYPAAAEAARWRAAFRVPDQCWGFRGKVEEYFLLSYEYNRRLL